MKTEGRFLLSFEPDLWKKLVDDPALTAEMYSFVERLTEGNDYGNVSEDEKAKNDQELESFADLANLVGRFLTSDYGEMKLSVYGGAFISGCLIGDCE